MRKIKRIIALVTVALFLLSLAAPAASAATKEEAFGRLNSLSVAVGDQNGDPLYDKNFTRAEAAAIMVNLSGMNAAINSAKGATKFKDVPASHWASGVINLAVGAGIIKGYPNGTYKPDANVTYAEMSAMLVGVLNYTPKLQGTWPSNVIGKAAQLGLLDGVNVSDYNAPAVRSNVFVAADNALDTKPLKETNNGFEEDTKTLMESKLSVTKLAEAQVTAVPNTDLNLTKNEVTLGVPVGAAPGAAALGTKKTIATLDPNPYLGLNVEAWVKDDKVFFLDTQTSSSDIITDKIDTFTDNGNNGPNQNDTIKLDASGNTYTLGAGVTAVKNFKAATNAAGGNGLAAKDEVKLILDGGQVKYLIANRFTSKLVDKVNTTDEKVTFENAGSLTFKDKVATIILNGKQIALGDIKAGDVVDYVANENPGQTDGAFYVVVTRDSTVSGKLTGSASDGKTLTIDGKDAKATGSVVLSTDNGETYNTTLTDGASYSSHFGKTVKGFKNKDGKICAMIATEGDASTALPVLVKDFKHTSGGATEATYLYVAKFDGTETYYEVNSDSKVNGKKVNATYKNADWTATLTNGDLGVANSVVRGEIVKISLTSDNKIDNISKFSNPINVAGARYAASTANKDAGTVAINNVAYKVDSNTKFLKVKEYKDSAVEPGMGLRADSLINNLQDANIDSVGYIDDVDTATWDSIKNLDTLAGTMGLVEESGVAKYVVLFDKNLTLASSYKYGVLVDTGNNSDGTYWNMKVDGAAMTKQFDNQAGGAPVDLATEGNMVKFKLNSDDEIDSANLMGGKLIDNTYDLFKIFRIDTTNKRIEIQAVTDDTGNTLAPGTAKKWIDVNDTTKYFDIEDTGDIKDLALDTLNANSSDIIRVYDCVDASGNDNPSAQFKGGELIYDFITRVNN